MKLYSDESGNESVRAAGHLVVSCVARVEVPAAIWRKSRLGELDPLDAALLVALFEAHYYGEPAEPPLFTAVALVDSVLIDAARLATTRALRTLDAVQLASAISARSADRSCETFVCFAAALRAAAAAEGFGVTPARAS